VLSIGENGLADFLRDTHLKYWKKRALSVSKKVFNEFDRIYNDDYMHQAKEIFQSIVESFDHFPIEPKGTNIIFEGSQGMKLDELRGQFPNVTRSSTGVTNVLNLCKQWDIDIGKIGVYGCSRTYTTRHGAGPLEGEDREMFFEDLTNVPNSYQETLRFSPTVNLKKEFKQMINDGINPNNLYLSLSCVDQTPTFILDETVYESVAGFEKKVIQQYNLAGMMISNGVNLNDTIHIDTNL
jgi:hypothetical protein